MESPIKDEHEELIRAQQSAYSIPGVDDNIPDRLLKKRKQEKAKPKQESLPVSNTAVYITGLPLDTKMDEMVDIFKKAGVILVDAISQLPKIKMYNDSEGAFKGDALVIYLRAESVELAVDILHDFPFRPEDKSVISVQPAVFNERDKEAKRQKKSSHDKRKGKAIQKLVKVLDWDEESDAKSKKTKSSKSVVLKFMFTLDELEKDPALVLDLKSDVREESERCGAVTNVILYDLEEDGVIMVRFKEEASANQCMMKMDGRFFAGRKISASISTGSEKFIKSKNDDAEAQQLRQDAYGTWLETNE